MYSTDHKKFNACSCITREGGASAYKRSMQHSRVQYECIRVSSSRRAHAHAHARPVHNSYLPVIGVHEMHGRMHPNYWQITILLVVDLCSSLAYFMTTQPLPIAGKLPIKTLVAKQLPTNMRIVLFACNVNTCSTCNLCVCTSNCSASTHMDFANTHGKLQVACVHIKY